MEKESRKFAEMNEKNDEESAKIFGFYRELR